MKNNKYIFVFIALVAILVVSCNTPDLVNVDGTYTAKPHSSIEYKLEIKRVPFTNSIEGTITEKKQSGSTSETITGDLMNTSTDHFYVQLWAYIGNSKTSWDGVVEENGNKIIFNDIEKTSKITLDSGSAVVNKIEFTKDK